VIFPDCGLRNECSIGELNHFFHMYGQLWTQNNLDCADMSAL
jgi:hypothetical protein